MSGSSGRQGIRGLFRPPEDPKAPVRVPRSLKYTFIGFLLATVAAILAVETTYFVLGYISRLRFMVEVTVTLAVAGVAFPALYILVRHAVRNALLVRREALAEKAFTESLLDALYDAFYMIDREGRLVRWNRIVEELTGYSHDELSRMRSEDLFEPDERRRAALQIERTFREGKSGFIKGIVLTKDGRKIPMEFYGTLLRDRSGNPLGICGIARDVSDREKAQEELRRSRETYRSLVEASPDAVFMLTLDGEILTASERAVEILGLDGPGELIGKSLLDLTAPEDHREVAEGIAGVVAEGRAPGGWECRMRRKEGALLPVEMAVAPVRGANGRPVAVVAVGRDVSERKEKERELEAYRERLEGVVEERTAEIRELVAALEQTGEGVTLVDLDGNMKFVNRAAARMHGYGVEEARMEHMRLFHTDEQFDQEVLPFYNRIVEEGEASAEIHHLRRDGTEFPTFMTGTLLRDDYGEPFGIVATVRDISEQKRVERELRDAEERYRGIVENAVDGIFQTSLDGRLVSANRALAVMLGYDSPEDLLEHVKTVVGLRVRPERREELVARLKSEGVVSGFEDEVYRKDGTTVWVRTSARLVRDREGDVVHIEGIVEDITERRAVEEALKREQAFTTGAVNAMRDLFVVTDLEGRLLRWNRYFAEFTGYADEELTSMTIADFFRGEDLERIKREVVNVTEKGHGFTEASLVTRDGKEFLFEHMGTALRDEEGRVIGVLGVARDITEKKRVELALRESEELYRTLVDASPDAVIVADLQAKVTKVSRRALQLFGYEDPGEMVGRNAFEFFPPHEKERARANFARRFGEEELGYIEYEFLRKDGTTFLGELNVAPFHDPDGSPRGVTAVLRDVTEKKRAEKEVRVARDKLEATLSALPDLMFETDVEGRIYDYRADERSLLYAPPRAFMGRTVEEVLPPDAASVIREALREADARGTHRGAVYSLDLPDGQRWFELSITAKGAPGSEERRLISLIRDITERRQFQVELERLNAELEGYAHSVSHDLKGPLSVIAAAEFTLKDHLCGDADGRVSPEALEALELIERSTDRARSLVEDLLAMAEAGQVPLEVEEVDVSVVVRRVLGDIAGEIKARGAEVIADPDLGRVVANPTQIYQAFANLVVNALRHNDSPAPVVNIRSLGRVEGGGHRYLVRDNGPGIPPEHLGRIFVPFFRNERTGGTGIGLSTVQKIVRAYGGEIKAYNDGGACFEFVIYDAGARQA